MERDPSLKCIRQTACPTHSLCKCLLTIYYGRCPWGRLKRRWLGLRRPWQYSWQHEQPRRGLTSATLAFQLWKSIKQSCEVLYGAGLEIRYKIVNVKRYHSTIFDAISWLLVNMPSHPYRNWGQSSHLFLLYSCHPAQCLVHGNPHLDVQINWCLFPVLR